jgi:hypothetical protein
MTRKFESYDYNIIDKEFVNDGKIKFEKTAEVTFFDESKMQIDKQDFAFIDSNSIYQKIDAKEDLNFNNCLILNFSLTEYRKERDLPETKFVVLREFSAQNSIFISENEVSFQKSNFLGKKANFNNCVFFCPKLTFANSNFEKADADFDYISFQTEELEFQYAIFGDYDVSFKNGLFGKGNKNFEEIKFGKGEISFLNVEFNEGNISFTGTDFGEGRTTFRIARFGEGKKDFSRVSFGGIETSFEKVEFGNGEISFRSANFGNGKVDFTRCEFGNGKKTFTDTNFGHGNTTFTGSNFGDGKINFKLAEFGEGLVDFHFCKFGEGELVFERTKFKEGGMDFRAVEFINYVVKFNRIEFGNGDIIFEAGEMKAGQIIFSFSVFGNGMFNFENAQYENADIVIEDVDFGVGKVSLKHSKFRSITLKSSNINNYFDLRIDKCGKLDLSSTIIKDILDISAHEFKVDIKELDLSGIRLLGRIYIDWKKSNVKELIYKQKTDLRNKSEQFRMLKENYHTLGMYDEEDYAYVEFKRTEAIAGLLDITSPIQKKGIKLKKYNIVRKAIAHISYFGKWLVFDKMGLYATAPTRVLFSMIIGYTFFSLLYVLLSLLNLGEIYPGPPDAVNISLIGKSFYMSVITFFTIGFGDFYPMGALRVVAGLEGFCGVFLMSYFTVAFVRKILR